MTRGRLPLLVLLLGMSGLAGGQSAVAEEETPAAEEGKALDELFLGEVVSIKRDVVTLRYDFSREDQKKDWFERLPFPAVSLEENVVSWSEGVLEIRGSHGIQHVGEWTGKLTVKATLVPQATRNFGGTIVPSSGTNDFAIFSVREVLFHKRDGKPGGDIGIIKFGDEFRDEGMDPEWVGFRYVADRRPPGDVVKGEPLPIEFGIDHEKLFMECERQKLKGRDLGVPLEVFHPGFFVVRGRIQIDQVEIEGTLDEQWLAAQGATLRIAHPTDGVR